MDEITRILVDVWSNTLDVSTAEKLINKKLEQQNKELKEQYIQDLQAHVPQSDARDNRIKQLLNK